jgi:hypothetical protein
MLKTNPAQSQFLFNSWIYFFLFLISNSLLSYFSFTFETTLWICLLGLIFPFILGLWSYKSCKNPKVPLHKLEFFKKIPFGIWIIIGILALFFRFYKLTTLSAWPIYDEGMDGFCAMQIAQKGVHHLFYMFSDIPVFYPWFLSVVFKLFGPSLFNLWFWPALISAIWIPLAYLTARSYFSKSFSFFCMLLAALSFWPCYTGRFSVSENLVLPLETLGFLWVAKCLHSESNKKKYLFAFILGLSLGISFYAVFLHWISVVLVIVLTACYLLRKRQPIQLVYLGLGLIVPLIPFMVIYLASSNSSYLHTLSTRISSEPLLNKIEIASKTLKGLFWGVGPDDLCYKPIWGGLLNPVLGSLFGIGLLEIFRNFKHPLYQWLCVACLVFLLPGMLVRDFEFYRILPALVILIPIIGLGWARLTQEYSLRWSPIILLIIMIPSVVLDLYQLFDVYPGLWNAPAYWIKESKSISDFRAYQILQTKALSEGPGLIFSDFVPGFDDQAINLADYQFNGVNNDHLDWEKANWAALIVNVNYQPFLAKRFGPGKPYWLSKDLNAADGGWMLWIINVTEENRPIFQQWRAASRSLNDYIYETFQNFTLVDDHFHSKALELFNGDYSLFEGDPFLESCYGEKKSDLFVRMRLIPEAAQSLNQAIQKGYPAANLFYGLGTLRLIENQPLEAQKAFQKACKAPLNFTQSSDFLKTSSGKPNAQL